MRVLISSGGTKIGLDLVRHIGNMSNGTLGSRLGRDFLKIADEVIFFRAEKSKSPMIAEVNFANSNLEANTKNFEQAKANWEQTGYKYHEHTYKSFEDYQSGLENLITLYKPDIIILAAAVSDYAPETVVQGKIRSKGNLDIHLVPLPKVISKVRDWAGDKATIVGFKLLVDVDKQELIDSAKKSLVENKLDLVCANDLRSILNGNHLIHLVDSSDIVKDIDAHSLARIIESHISTKGKQ
ncbi:MAG: hypothetical protein M0P12_01240 [Paludibacteraceae bacterium]|nr:hypothetical protein [Paludibacteraceae bacterium]